MQKWTLIIAMVLYVVTFVALLTMHDMLAMYLMVIGMLIECSGHLVAMLGRSQH